MSKPIAILNMTRMGDLLMTAPMIEQIRSQHPDSEIHLIVVEGFAAIAEGLNVDRVIPVDYNGLTTVAVRAFSNADTGNAGEAYTRFNRWVESLRETEYDAIYNITHTRISAVLTSLMRGEVKAGIHLDRQGYRSIAGPWSRYWFAGNLNRGINPYHLVDMNVQMAKEPGAERVDVAMNYSFDPSAADAADDLLRGKGIKAGEDYVVLQVGASADDKRWEPEKFGRVAALLTEQHKLKSVFVGTKDESSWVESALTLAGNDAVSVAGETSLPVLAAVLGKAKLVVSNDTGTMHLAQAVGTRVIAITLGSALSDETGPYGCGNLIVEPDIDCFPCDFKEVCAAPICHERITPDLIASLAGGMIGGNVRAAVEGYSGDDKAIVWETAFDDAGWWYKKPLTPLRLKKSELIRALYRQAIRTLYDSKEAEVERSATRIAAEWCERYSQHNVSGLLEELGVDRSHLDQLLGTAKEAYELAGNIDRHSGGGSQMFSLLARESESLATLDETIIGRGLESDLTKPLIVLFRFGLENLPVEGLAEQVRATLTAHSDLMVSLKTIKNLLDTIEQAQAVEHFEQPVKPGNSDLLRRSRLTGDKVKVLLPTNGYYLQSEVASALTSMGHKVIPIPFEGRDDVINRLLTESLDADLLLTINHLGFDREGELASLLHRIDMPYVSWFVDRPSFILLNHELGPQEHATIATWESASIPELEGYGFESVQWLPLATDDRRFTRRGRKSGAGSVRFVANSMITPVREWLEKAGRDEEDTLVQRAVSRLLSSRVDPELAMAATFEEMGMVQTEDGEEWLKLCSAVALLATREYRNNLASTMQGVDLHLYGDEGWKELAPNLPWHGPVAYPRGLAEVYREAVHLNATSFQMPTAVNQRVFDVPAAGGVVITDGQESMGELFDVKKECLIYSSPEEAREMATWAVDHPEEAKAISDRAAQRIENEHTYRHRLAELLERVRARRLNAAVRIAGGR